MPKLTKSPDELHSVQVLRDELDRPYIKLAGVGRMAFKYLDAERLERAQEQAERAPDLYGEGPEYDGFVWTDEDEDYSKLGRSSNHGVHSHRDC